ncbi:poly(beta-D-mannuronate) lyase [Rhodoligotrophos appendicifer]|uniref:alginate lyase family protein n=1 Tax=Rhodoligotrophos appendicifer TaxID=987056 RepID=UPI0014780FD6|nr:alginate lyase family protein [Rhodoligotrophos appendicifer]
MTPPRQPLAVEAFYKDRQGREIDALRRAARDRAVAPYEAFVRLQQERADAFLLRDDVIAGGCALADMILWADSGVLTQDLASLQANYERNWYLVGFALAYLKLKPMADIRQRRQLETWLHAMATPLPNFLGRRDVPPNNLTYWAGAALAAASLATGDLDMWAQANAVLKQGLADIQADGTLPLEMTRGAKARSYHAFAAEALTLMAFIAQARGEPVDPAPLKRLVDIILRGLQDPSAFRRTAGAAQEEPAEWSLSWLALYGQILPFSGDVPAYGARTHFLGGDVAATMQAIRRAGS